MNAARQGGIPIFLRHGQPPQGWKYTSMILTDTDMRLRPWPGAECNPSVHGATEGSWEQTVISEIQPQPQDYIIPKYRWSTFHQTYFDLALRSRRIDTIIIAGGAVDVGIASTTYAARDLDYNVIIVRDACSNSYEYSMAAFMDTIFPRMARVRSTDQVIEMLHRQETGRVKSQLPGRPG